MDLRLSRHFEERWREYFGRKPPRVEEVLRIIRRSVWTQRCALLYDADGTQHKILAHYWHPEKKIIIKVDWIENKVVTVITPACRCRDKRSGVVENAMPGHGGRRNGRGRRSEVGGRRSDGKRRSNGGNGGKRPGVVFAGA